RIVRPRPLRLLDVVSPLLVLVDRVDRQTDDLHAPPVELRLDARHIAELSRAHRGEILRMREQHTPRIAQPVMEPNRPLRRLSLEIGGSVTERQCHLESPPYVVSRQG